MKKLIFISLIFILLVGSVLAVNIGINTEELGVVEVEIREATILDNLFSLFSILLNPELPKPGEKVKITFGLGYNLPSGHKSQLLLYISKDGKLLSNYPTPVANDLPAGGVSYAVTTSFTPRMIGNYEIKYEIFDSTDRKIITTESKKVIVKEEFTECTNKPRCTEFKSAGSIPNGESFLQECFDVTAFPECNDRLGKSNFKTVCNSGFVIEGTSTSSASGDKKCIPIKDLCASDGCLPSSNSCIYDGCGTGTGNQCNLDTQSCENAPEPTTNIIRTGTAKAIEFDNLFNGILTAKQISDAQCDATSECNAGECIKKEETELFAIDIPLLTPTLNNLNLLIKGIELKFGKQKVDNFENNLRVEAFTEKSGLCIMNYGQGVEKIKQIEKGEITEEFETREPLTLDELKGATQAEVQNSLCNLDSDCEPKEGFTIDCTSEKNDIVSSKLGITGKLSQAFKKEGICLAEELNKKSFLDSILYEKGNFKITGLTAIIGAIALLFLFSMFGRKS